ncbi:TELO2-interacting protein 1 homolog isoform X1 [Spodoptera litura]|uniref:TELO2-interacting protein 1 homolog isoform X1 n=1 Tax=Spodoptera litura TaxID=69820 RepID=A0A9J7IUV8_SPOLT|nr:TELO2-interacting protein 1 homolog isoform X1 [Spodoptera litura]
MNADLKDAFSRIKPVCDVLMVCPTEDSIAAYLRRVAELKKEVIQELQQYLLFPLITHLKSTETEKKHELQQKLVDCMRTVLEKVTVNSFEMCMKMEIGLLQIVFDHTKPGMVADVPEELKCSVMTCLTVLLLNVDPKYREVMLKAHVPLLGKAVYVSVHLAKLERLRALRLAAIQCVTAHTATHPKLTTDYHITDPIQEKLVVDMLSLILPGVMGALQDVATCKDNPGHALIVTAIDAMHRILCLAMNNKYMNHATEPTAEDFMKVYRQKGDKEVSNKVDPKTLPVRSAEWFKVASQKVLIINQHIVALRTHEHFKVRKELAIYFARMLVECDVAMVTSIPLALDTLILLAKDEYPEVAEYCSSALSAYFENASEETRSKTLDSLCKNFFTAINSLPRVMNNIDSSRKLSSLNLVHGYVSALGAGPGQRLTAALSARDNVQAVCVALLQCVAIHADLTMLTQHAVRDVISPPPMSSPWCKLRHLDDELCERRVQEILSLLGEAECASLLLDQLFELFQLDRSAEVVYICNWMAAAPNSSEDFVKRILNTYIEEDVWYLPLEVGMSEPALNAEDTLDVSVYNPRSWDKDYVPDLYEGAIETRYTDISYRAARPKPHTDPNKCATLGDAQRNMLLSCLLTEGVGVIARRLMHKYQPFLLKTLCLVLERVGSKYEMLHLAGLKAIHGIAEACGHSTVAELIKHNADYFTNQVTVRLKKAWNCQSALQILSVVMEYSDSSILNYLYGIVEDVLVQSCDKYYENDLQAYLQVFLTFVECIRKWYEIPDVEPKPAEQNREIDILNDLLVFIENREIEQQLLNDQEFENRPGRSAEEMYREDIRRREEEMLDYDDTVTGEKPPLPQHIIVTVTILKRCLNYVTSSQRDNSILALQVLTRGLPILGKYDDELLPLVHKSWGPLVSRFDKEPAIMKRAFDLLVTMAALARDFIRGRAIRDVLPHIYSFLDKSSKESYLKDIGSAYRNSQAYSLQLTALGALPHLTTDLMLEDESLENAMTCVQPYLSKKQPKALQALAVEFFKRLLDYNHGATWYHLRNLCNNTQLLEPPTREYVHLFNIVGSPYIATDKDYQSNIKLIFERKES